MRVRNSEGGLVSRDSCVVAVFTQQLRWGIRNGKPIERTAEYVGFIEEILELDYRNHCTTTLLCEWVKPTRDGRVSNIERDRTDSLRQTSTTWTVGCNRIQSHLHFIANKYSLYDDPSRRGWKVLLRIDVRGRCLQIHHAQPAAHVIVVGNDEDFRGLQPTIQETEPLRRPAPTGGHHVTAATNTTTAQDSTEEE